MEVVSYLLGKKAGGGGSEPTGTINITENGTHNVKAYATANVNVSGGTDTRWQQIGYEGEPEAIQDGIDYAKEIMQNWDDSITDRSGSFNGNNDLMFFPEVDTSNILNAYNMFYNCRRLISIGDFDFSSITNAQNMFYYCSSLSEVGDIILPNTNIRMQDMFNGCSALKKIGTLTINDKDVTGLFTNCSSLTTIESIQTNVIRMHQKNFEGCPNLSNDTLKVILNFLKQLTNQHASFKNLKAIGLSQTQAELCATFSEWTELANSGWTTGY